MPTPAPSTDPTPGGDHRIGLRDLTHWPTRSGRWVLAWVSRLVDLLGPVGRWGRANVALVITVGVGGFLVLVLDLLAAEVYEGVTEREDLAGLDQPVLNTAVALRTPARDAAVTAFTDIGGTVGMPVLVLLGTVLLVVLHRSRAPVVIMVIAATGSVLLTVLGKDLTGRARPPLGLAVPPYETSASFPSGHTLNATVLVGALAYLLLLWAGPLRWRVVTLVVATLFVLAMGLSRVYLGHHWLTDVVAGWLLGLGWLAAVVTGHRVQLTISRDGLQLPAETSRQATSSR